MPLEILGILVVGGIGGIALILHVLGFSQSHQMKSTSEAMAAWTREFPQMWPVEAHLSDDGRAALIRTEHNKGLVWSLGADTVARQLGRAAVKTHKHGLEFTFSDLGVSPTKIRLSPKNTALWQEVLNSE